MTGSHDLHDNMALKNIFPFPLDNGKGEI